MYRLLGKFFFLFYICPRIAREFRSFRKFVNPLINAKIRAELEKAKINTAADRNNTPDWARQSHLRRV